MSAAVVLDSTVPIPAEKPHRKIIARTRGQRHGPITRLVSPSDIIGELIKPFVFLDYFEADPGVAPQFGWHPHSGIATLTLLLEGEIAYADTTGASGVLRAGGIEWMQAGGGVWHTGTLAGKSRIRGYQLWVALPPALENGPAASRYLRADQVTAAGPLRVALGSHGSASSLIPAPAAMDYLDVRLKAGERFEFHPRAGHTVAWIAVHRGEVQVPESVSAGELVVFDDSGNPINFVATGDADFVLGSAVKHPHDLVLGYYSVHTTRAALSQGETEIQNIRRRFESSGEI
jgi:redox-sensitive bicupin YhaK (pirin superfamily)